MLFLNPGELVQLTGRKKRNAQALALRNMGIEHKIRPDGAVIVSRLHIQKLLDGESANRRILKEIQPNWGAMSAKITQA